MSNVKVRTLSLDSETFDLLTELAKETKVTKTMYLRQSIREAARRQGRNDVMPLGALSTNTEQETELPVDFEPISIEPEPDMVLKRGKWIPIKKLPAHERWATRVAVSAGITIDLIDIEKLKKDISDIKNSLAHLNLEFGKK